MSHRLLVIEDAEDKRSTLVQFVRRNWSKLEITEARSLQGGLRQLVNVGADVILLDMSMPTYDIGRDESGGRHKPFAGNEFFQQMVRRDINRPVIVVTQFDTFGQPPHERTLAVLHDELQEQYPKLFVGSVYFHATSDAWQPQLRSLLERAFARLV